MPLKILHAESAGEEIIRTLLKIFQVVLSQQISTYRIKTTENERIVDDKQNAANSGPIACWLGKGKGNRLLP